MTGADDSNALAAYALALPRQRLEQGRASWSHPITPATLAASPRSPRPTPDRHPSDRHGQSCAPGYGSDPGPPIDRQPLDGKSVLTPDPCQLQRQAVG